MSGSLGRMDDGPGSEAVPSARPGDAHFTSRDGTARDSDVAILEDLEAEIADVDAALARIDAGTAGAGDASVERPVINGTS